MSSCDADRRHGNGAFLFGRPLTTALLAAVVVAGVWGDTASARVLDPARISTQDLANGVRVIVKSEHDVPVVAVCALVRGGASVETPAERGLAHVLEHMVFQRPEEDSPIGRLPLAIEALGGEILAETSSDSTRYTITVAPDGLKDAVAALALEMRDPVIDPQRLRAELEIMRRELDGVYGGALVNLRGAIQEALFGEGPYGHSPGGGPGPLPDHTVAAVSAFHQKHYIGPNVAVVVVGDVAPEVAHQVVAEAFGSLPGGAPTFPTQAPPPMAGPRVVSAPRAAPLVGLGFPAPGMSSPKDVLATDVFLGVLSEGETSRLRDRLPKLVPEIGGAGAGFLTQRLPGHLYLWADPGRASPDIVLASLGAILTDLRDQPVSAEECRRGALVARTLHAMGCDTYTSQAQTLAFYEAIGSWEFGVTYEDAIMEVTPEDLQRVARTYFDPDRALVVRSDGEGQGP